MKVHVINGLPNLVLKCHFQVLIFVCNVGLVPRNVCMHLRHLECVFMAQGIAGKPLLLTAFTSEMETFQTALSMILQSQS